jgi:hypothetical protein
MAKCWTASQSTTIHTGSTCTTFYQKVPATAHSAAVVCAAAAGRTYDDTVGGCAWVRLNRERNVVGWEILKPEDKPSEGWDKEMCVLGWLFFSGWVTVPISTWHHPVLAPRRKCPRNSRGDGGACICWRGAAVAYILSFLFVFATSLPAHMTTCGSAPCLRRRVYGASMTS